MRLRFVCVLAVLLAACGGGGGGSRLTCRDDKPLLCPHAEGCCARGLPYSCDGICYSVQLAYCVESDFCTFNVKGLAADDVALTLPDPMKTSEPMFAAE